MTPAYGDLFKHLCNTHMLTGAFFHLSSLRHGTERQQEEQKDPPPPPPPPQPQKNFIKIFWKPSPIY